MRKIKKIYKRFLARLDKNDFNYKEAMEVYKKANALLIDVRTPEEYRKEHIDGAINIPVYEIDNKKNEIIDQDKVNRISKNCLERINKIICWTY